MEKRKLMAGDGVSIPHLLAVLLKESVLYTHRFPNLGWSSPSISEDPVLFSHLSPCFPPLLGLTKTRSGWVLATGSICMGEENKDKERRVLLEFTWTMETGAESCHSPKIFFSFHQGEASGEQAQFPRFPLHSP